MKKWNKNQIIASLKKQGVHFSDFSLTHEGEYATEDADWNYKDVPHLHHVHELVEAVFTLMDDPFITTINVQKVLGLKLPLCVVNYQSGPNEQTYYTSYLFYVLIVHTKYEKLGPCQTRVITQYNIGYPRILKWSVPIIRFLIKRNYQNLMSTDIPMRTRRGALRKLGYSFYKEDEYYSFPKTMDILEENIEIPTHLMSHPVSIPIDPILPHDGEYLYGKDNHNGFRLVRQGHDLHIFSRMCLHEGASLDNSPCINKKVKCPWHGRLHSPLASFDLTNQNTQQIQASLFEFNLTNRQLTITEQTKASRASSPHSSILEELA